MTERLQLVVVDDDPAFAQLVRLRLLQGQSASRPFDLERAATLEAGIELVDAAPRDLILLDLGLPGCDDLESLERMRRETTAPIVVLTGRSDDGLARRCMRSGADDYLLKDSELTSAVLWRAIDHAIGRRLEARRAVLEQYQGLAAPPAEVEVQPLRETVPGAFQACALRYQETLLAYLGGTVKGMAKPHESMQEIVSQLGELRCGARDLIDLHLAALDEAANAAPHQYSDSLATQGRLFALEMMGLLVDQYRWSTTAPASEGETP